MNQWPAWLPLRQNLRELSPYGAPQLPADAVMNTNENPYAPSPALAKAIADRVSEVALTLNRYPDRDAVVSAHQACRVHQWAIRNQLRFKESMGCQWQQ